MSYNTDLQSNNTDLRTILNAVNELPEMPVVELPELTNPATAGKILEGYDAINEKGVAVSGTMEDWSKYKNPGYPTLAPKTGDIKLYPYGNQNNKYTTYDVPEGYHDGKTTVSVPSVKYFTVIPSERDQYVQALDETSPTGRVYIEGVVVEPIPSEYQNTTKVTAAAADVLSGKMIVTQDGETAGTMPNNGDVSVAFDGLTSTSVTIPAGYTSGGTISLTDDIERALAAI